METEELLKLSLPEIYSLISDNTRLLKEQQEYCDYLFEVLKQKKDQEVYESYLRKIAAAERIEKKISLWLKKNWYRFQFLYPHYKCRQLDVVNVRLDSNVPHVVLPKQIMIYFTCNLSGLTREEICEYFELNQKSDISYAIKKTEEYSRDEKFAYQMTIISNLL